MIKRMIRQWLGIENQVVGLSEYREIKKAIKELRNEVYSLSGGETLKLSKPYLMVEYWYEQLRDGLIWLQMHEKLLNKMLEKKK